MQGTGATITVADSIGTVFYSLIGQGIPINPMEISHRILVFSICLTGGVLFWSYCAGLVSFLAVEKLDYPIKSYGVSHHLFVNIG